MASGDYRMYSAAPTFQLERRELWGTAVVSDLGILAWRENGECGSLEPRMHVMHGRSYTVLYALVADCGG